MVMQALVRLLVILPANIQQNSADNEHHPNDDPIHRVFEHVPVDEFHLTAGLLAVMVKL